MYLFLFSSIMKIEILIILTALIIMMYIGIKPTIYGGKLIDVFKIYSVIARAKSIGVVMNVSPNIRP